jgi:hypothetical protein
VLVDVGRVVDHHVAAVLLPPSPMFDFAGEPFDRPRRTPDPLRGFSNISQSDTSTDAVGGVGVVSLFVIPSSSLFLCQ